jgi:hypothetical protein
MDVYAGFRWYGAGDHADDEARWGCTWRVYVALGMLKLLPHMGWVQPDSNVGGPAIVDDFGTLVLVEGMQ